jgi:N-acetylmuramoyl-L-alanine amidase
MEEIGMILHLKRVLLVFMVLVLLFTFGCQAIPAVAYKVGSRGEQVKEIQRRLINWGYLKGGVADGIYGPVTRAAVMWFQEKNRITVDGIVGAQTAEKLGIALSSSKPSSNDVYLLARVVYGEARGEPYKGKVAVAAVVLNRVGNAQFPNTVAKVVYQPGAFSIVADGQINLAPDDSALQAARDAMNGWDPSGGALFYYNPRKTTNSWIRSRPVITYIGQHTFCK